MNNTNIENLRKASQAMIYGVHPIFSPPDVTNHNGFDPVSEGRLEKGEGTCTYKKETLGWDFDGTIFTIQLQPKKGKINHQTN